MQSYRKTAIVYLALFSAMLIWGLSFLAIKDAVKTIPIFTLLFLFGPLAATDGLRWLTQVTPTIVSEILFLGVLCSAGAFFAMHYALVHLPATQVAVSANSIPLITLFAEVLLMGTRLTFFKVLGTLATIAGVMLTQLDKVNLKTVVEGIEKE